MVCRIEAQLTVSKEDILESKLSLNIIIVDTKNKQTHSQLRAVIVKNLETFFGDLLASVQFQSFQPRQRRSYDFHAVIVNFFALA